MLSQSRCGPLRTTIGLPPPSGFFISTTSNTSRSRGHRPERSQRCKMAIRQRTPSSPNHPQCRGCHVSTPSPVNFLQTLQWWRKVAGWISGPASSPVFGPASLQKGFCPLGHTSAHETASLSAACWGSTGKDAFEMEPCCGTHAPLHLQI